MTIFKTGSNIFKTSGKLLTVADDIPVLTWDANGATANQTDGGGAWSGANLWWNGATNQSWAGKAKAVFGNNGTAGTVTLASPITVHNLTFRRFSGTYTIGTIGQLLSIRYGIDKQNNSGAVTFNGPMKLEADQAWSNNSSGILTFNTNATVDTNGKTLTLIANLGTIDFAYAGAVISGAGGIVKKGMGRLLLGDNPSPAHSYSGPTVIEGGVLMLSNVSANWLPNSNIQIKGGILEFYWSVTITKTLGAGADQIQVLEGSSGFACYGTGQTTTITFNNNANYELVWGSTYFKPTVLVAGLDNATNDSSYVTINNKIDLNGATRTIEVRRNTTHTTRNLTLSGVIRDSVGGAGLIKTGLGRLILNTSNTFNGGVVVTSGSITLGNAGALGSAGNRNLSFTGSGTRELTHSAASTANNNLVVDAGVSLEVTPTQSGSYTTTSGGGNITYLGANNNNTQLTLGDASAFTGILRNYVGGHGTNAPGKIVQFTSLSDTASLQFGGGDTNGAQAVKYKLYGNATPLTLSVRQVQLYAKTSGSNSLSKASLLNDNATPANKWVITPDLYNALDRTATLEFGGTNTGLNEFSGIIGDSTNGGYALSIQKTDTGSWTLSGINTYTGTTTVDGTGGVLRITGSITSNTTVTLGTLEGNNTAGGSCTITGTVTVANSASAILRPGSFGDNTMNTGALTFSGTSSRLTIDSTTTTMSKVVVTGNVALGGTGVIFNAGITTNGTYKIITATGTMSGTLPSIITNSTGKTIVLQQNGNDLEAVVS